MPSKNNQIHLQLGGLNDKHQLSQYIVHQSYGTHVAPLGLGGIGLPMFYKHAAPLGL